MSSIPRFFVPPETISGEVAVLPPDAAHHARSVLRLRVGEAIVLHDGTGFGYRCRLTEVAPKSVQATVEEKFAVLTEPSVHLTVVQALPKTSDKAEQILQHGTEVGASAFVFFPSERSVARMETREKLEKRLERWSEIVTGAAEQSGRGLLPSVAWEARFDGVLKRIALLDVTLVLHEKATTPLADALTKYPDATAMAIVIGPEGGLTESEVTCLETSGAISVTLGPRVLRTETAALVALAQILYARERGKG